MSPLTQRVFSFTFVVVTMVMPLILVGCPEERVACQVIRAASDVCTIIEYVGDDGKIRQESVDPRDLQQLAKSSAARRAAKDASAD